MDAETIIAGLETVTAIKPKIGHLLKDEHEQSGKLLRRHGMEYEMSTPSKESIRRDSLSEETIHNFCILMLRKLKGWP